MCFVPPAADLWQLHSTWTNLVSRFTFFFTIFLFLCQHCATYLMTPVPSTTQLCDPWQSADLLGIGSNVLGQIIFQIWVLMESEGGKQNRCVWRTDGSRGWMKHSLWEGLTMKQGGAWVCGTLEREGRQRRNGSSSDGQLTMKKEGGHRFAQVLVLSQSKSYLRKKSKINQNYHQDLIFWHVKVEGTREKKMGEWYQ